MHLSCLVKAYPPPTAKIMKISPYEELNSLEEFTESLLDQVGGGSVGQIQNYMFQNS